MNAYFVVGNCDFESKTFCTWVNLQNDDFDWLVGSGSTSSSLTGPSQDHTHNQDSNGSSQILGRLKFQDGNFAFLWRRAVLFEFNGVDSL